MWAIYIGMTYCEVQGQKDQIVLVTPVKVKINKITECLLTFLAGPSAMKLGRELRQRPCPLDAHRLLFWPLVFFFSFQEPVTPLASSREASSAPPDRFRMVALLTSPFSTPSSELLCCHTGHAFSVLLRAPLLMSCTCRCPLRSVQDFSSLPARCPQALMHSRRLKSPLRALRVLTPKPVSKCCTSEPHSQLPPGHFHWDVPETSQRGHISSTTRLQSHLSPCAPKLGEWHQHSSTAWAWPLGSVNSSSQMSFESVHCSLYSCPILDQHWGWEWLQCDIFKLQVSSCHSSTKQTFNGSLSPFH